MMMTRMLSSRSFATLTRQSTRIVHEHHKTASQCVRKMSLNSEKDKMRAHLFEKWLGKKEVYPLIALMGCAVALTTTFGVYYLVTSPDVHLHRSSRRTMRVTPAEQEAAAARTAAQIASSGDVKPMVIDSGVRFEERK